MGSKGRDLEAARAAKAKVIALLGSNPKVVGIGLTYIDGGFGVKLNLSELESDSLPEEVDGVPLKVEVVGPLTKRPESDPSTTEAEVMRPSDLPD